jgi:hypothetical protein
MEAPPPHIAAIIAERTPPGNIPINDLVPGTSYRAYNIFLEKWYVVQFLGIVEGDWYNARYKNTESTLSIYTTPLYDLAQSLRNSAWARRSHAVIARARHAAPRSAAGAAGAAGAANARANNANRNKAANTKKNERRRTSRKNRKTRRY